jgi:predicted nuclease of predicted toxin-antitoxin system
MKLPEQLVLFLDRALGKHKVANILLNSQDKYEGIEVVVHCLDDFFPPDTPDENWLKHAGENSWIVITKDKKIRYRKPEFEMVRKHNVRMFTLTSGNITAEDIGDILSKSIPAIAKFVRTTEPPFIATISKTGILRNIEID